MFWVNISRPCTFIAHNLLTSTQSVSFCSGQTVQCVRKKGNILSNPIIIDDVPNIFFLFFEHTVFHIAADDATVTEMQKLFSSFFQKIIQISTSFLLWNRYVSLLIIYYIKRYMDRDLLRHVRKYPWKVCFYRTEWICDAMEGTFFSYLLLVLI